MNSYEIKIIEAARKIDRLEKDYLKLMYETKAPENRDELQEYAKRLWLIGSESFDIRNEIVAEYPSIKNLQINGPSVKKTLEKTKLSIQSRFTSHILSFLKESPRNRLILQ